jgi:hypothetical protein
MTPEDNKCDPKLSSARDGTLNPLQGIWPTLISELRLPERSYALIRKTRSTLAVTFGHIGLLASISSGCDVMLIFRTEEVNAWKDRNEVDSTPDPSS